jgi:FkbM family methyltransferase
MRDQCGHSGRAAFSGIRPKANVKILPRIHSKFVRSLLAISDRTNYETMIRSILDDAVSRGPEIAALLMAGKSKEVEILAALHPLMATHGINYCIDIGGHSGQFGCGLYGYLGFRGTCVSFEPVGTFYKTMTTRAQLYSNWRTVSAGVSDRAGEGVIRLGEGHGGTSSLLPSTELLEKLAPDARLAGRKEIVRLVRLDEHLRDDLENPNHRIHVKVDTQGSELAVLRSLGAYIGRVSLLVVECAAQTLYDGQPLFEEVLLYLRGHGFSPAYVANNFGVGDAYYDYDVIFVPSEH